MLNYTVHGVLAAFAFALCGCGSSFIGKHPASEVKSGERVTITLTEASGEAEAVPVALLAAVIPKVVDLGVQVVEREIAREKARYSASYRAFGAGANFYASDAVDAPIALQRVRLERTVLVKKGSTRSRETASLLEFDVIATNENRFIRLVPRTFVYNYSKAKTRSGDNDIDITITVRVHSYFYDEKGGLQIVTTEVPPMRVPGVVLGEAWSFDAEDPTSADYFGNLSTAWIPAVGRTKFADHRFGTGAYTVEIIVDERDAFGDTIEKVEAVVKEHKDDARDRIVDSLLKVLDLEEEDGDGGSGTDAETPK